MDRLTIILTAANRVQFTKTQAAVLVGGRRRLERLAAQGRIRYSVIDDGRFGRWQCNGADVLRYAKEREELS